VTSVFGIKVCFFCVFLENDKTDLRQKFFSEFKRKQLFITICIEKHCTRPLKMQHYDTDRSWIQIECSLVRVTVRKVSPTNGDCQTWWWWIGEPCALFADINRILMAQHYIVANECSKISYALSFTPPPSDWV